MTKNNPIDFIRQLRSITLPSALRDRIRADLSAYADLHTLNEQVASRPVQSLFSAFMFRTRSLYAGALALVLIVACGTQVTLAAEGTVPGDILYPVKVAVSEPIALTLAASSAQKAELAARFASRRVDEAATLSSEGRLDEKTANELATSFDTHVDVLAKETEALEAKGDIAVSLAVRTDLEQKISSQVEGFAPAPVAVAMAKSASVAVEPAPEAPETHFADRIYLKSRTLATTRERLDSALALDTEASLDAGMDLGVIAVSDTAADAQPSARLFFAKQDEGSAVMMMSEVAATTTATSTATTTETVEAVDESAASRFFAPFRKR